jgi:hypothetical protein
MSTTEAPQGSPQGKKEPQKINIRWLFTHGNCAIAAFVISAIAINYEYKTVYRAWYDQTHTDEADRKKNPPSLEHYIIEYLLKLKGQRPAKIIQLIALAFASLALWQAVLADREASS